MEIIQNLLRDMKLFLIDGGGVMIPLTAATFLLWYGIAYRMVMLKRGGKGSVRDVVRRFREEPEGETGGFLDLAVSQSLKIRNQIKGDIHPYLEETLFPLSEEMRRFRSLVRTIVLVAPLAGLLGTVSGMIEMFDSLGSQTFYSQTGGIANGISQALFTTQFGLVIALPGLIIGLALDRKEDAIREEFEQLKEYLNCSVPAGETL